MKQNTDDKTGTPTPVSAKRTSRGAVQGGLESGSNTVQVVEFLLGKEHFAVDLFNVREVVEYKTITQLPDTPAYIKGIIDLRGEITTIIDLKERLNIIRQSGATDENSRIIVLDDSITESKTGIMVDNVSSVTTFDRSAVDTSTSMVEQNNSAIIGIIKKKIRVKDRDAHELLILIDIKRLVSDESVKLDITNLATADEVAA
ncbi:MAG: chemotaxis protein CheW [Methanoregula sp.]|jgi:purine-binding chemotaxis protein CheW